MVDIVVVVDQQEAADYLLGVVVGTVVDLEAVVVGIEVVVLVEEAVVGIDRLAEAAVGIVLVEEAAVGIGVVRLEEEVVVETAAVLLVVGIVRVAAAVVGIVVDWGVERIAAAADDKPVVREFRARVEPDVPEAAEEASCRDLHPAGHLRNRGNPGERRPC